MPRQRLTDNGTDTARFFRSCLQIATLPVLLVIRATLGPTNNVKRQGDRIGSLPDSCALPRRRLTARVDLAMYFYGFTSKSRHSGPFFANCSEGGSKQVATVNFRTSPMCAMMSFRTCLFPSIQSVFLQRHQQM
uniref:Uncharacterized protein n=1 Tax=Hippocampus comes TaxID=109280 RepID=A0A3Q2ZPB1_HIPCM